MHKWLPNLVAKFWLPNLVLYQTVYCTWIYSWKCARNIDGKKHSILHENHGPSFAIYLQLICWCIWPRQNGRHFRDNTFKSIFLTENIRISLKSLSLRGTPINNIPPLVQIMAWHWSGAKPLSKQMMVRLLMHICLTRPQWVNPGHQVP